MTDTKASREPGYRGALPPRTDRLAPLWVITVAGVMVLVFVLSVLGIPSRFFPEPTPIPLPSVSASPSASLSVEASPSASPPGSAAPSPSGASPSVAPSASPSPAAS